MCAQVCMCAGTCVCVSMFARLEKRKGSSGSSRQAGATSSPSAQGTRGREREAPSLHLPCTRAQEGPWLGHGPADQLCVCWGRGEMLITLCICAFHFLQGAAAKTDGEEQWLRAQEPDCCSFAAESSSVPLGKLSNLSVPRLPHL